MRFIKEFLRVGTYHPPGLPKPVTFTAADIAEIHRNGNALVRAGDAPPMGWEHHSGLVPMSLQDRAAERCKHHLCYTSGFALSRDGQRVFSIQDVPDADAATVQRVGFVSPGLQRNLKTGDGKTYSGWCPVHVAVTPRPVNKNQAPFVAMGQNAQAVLCLSLNDLEGANVDDDELDENVPAEAVESDPPPEVEPPPPPPTPEAQQISQAVDLAAQCGLLLGEDTTPANFMDRFVVAAQTYLAAQGELNGEQPDQNTGLEPGSAPKDATPAPVGSGGLTMSLESVQEKLVAHERKALAVRIAKLQKTGRIPPVTARALNNELTAVNLSLADDATLVPNAVLAKIEAYEALPANKDGFKAPTSVDLSLANPIPLPDDGDVPNTDKAIARFDATLGRVKKK